MIKADNVTKRFDDFLALDSISCKIPQGCIYGMVGSNGAGKSTFLRMITGVYKSDSGQITIEDKAVYDNPEVKSRIAYVPDELFFLPGAHIDRMAQMYQSVYPNFDMDRFQYLKESFQLPDRKSLHSFSKGMRRQTATILAVSARPDYIFFDETFDGLDPIMRKLVKGLICQDVAERNATAIITSHSLRELEDTCDQLALLHEGGLVFERDVEHMKTSLFKLQIAFEQDYGREMFEGMEILHYLKKGSVTNMIIKGDRDEVVARMQQLQPLILDVLPLSLEEIFTYEMEVLGYSFHNVLEGE